MFDIQLRGHLGGPPTADVPLIIVNPFLLSALSVMCNFSADSMLYNASLHGFAESVVFGPDTLISDLTESTYPGYAPVVANFAEAGPGYDDIGTPIVIVDPLPWSVSGDPAGEALAGVYLLTLEGRLIGGATLPAPIVLADGQVIPTTLAIQLGNT